MNFLIKNLVYITDIVDLYEKRNIFLTYMQIRL